MDVKITFFITLRLKETCQANSEAEKRHFMISMQTYKDVGN